MLSIPDYAHFYAITQANAKARATLSQPANSQTCAPFLGSDSPLSMAAADAAAGHLRRDSRPGLRTRSRPPRARPASSTAARNEALLSEKDFTIGDLSTVDYFHPSLSGQAKMAASAWQAGYWARVPLPPGAAAAA